MPAEVMRAYSSVEGHLFDVEPLRASNFEEEEPDWLKEAGKYLQDLSAAEVLRTAVEFDQQLPIHAAAIRNVVVPEPKQLLRPKPNVTDIDSMAIQQIELMGYKPTHRSEIDTSYTSMQRMKEKALTQTPAAEHTSMQRMKEKALTQPPATESILSTADLAALDPLATFMHPPQSSQTPISTNLVGASLGEACTTATPSVDLPPTSLATPATDSVLDMHQLLKAMFPAVKDHIISATLLRSGGKVEMAADLILGMLQGTNVLEGEGGVGVLQEKRPAQASIPQVQPDAGRQGGHDYERRADIPVPLQTDGWHVSPSIHSAPESATIRSKRLTGEKPSWSKAGHRFTGSVAHAVVAARAKAAKHSMRKYGHVA